RRHRPPLGCIQLSTHTGIPRASEAHLLGPVPPARRCRLQHELRRHRPHLGSRHGPLPSRAPARFPGASPGGQPLPNALRYGGRLPTTSEDNRARLWDTKTCQAVAPPLVHTAWAMDAQFSQDGERVLTALRKNAARFWNAATSQPISPYIMHPVGRVVQASFTADDSHFVTASFD